MAKQKKKKKQKNDKIKKRERGKFDYLFIVPYVVIVTTILNYEKVCYFCAKAFTNVNGYFYQMKSASLLIAFFVLISILLLVTVVYIDNAKNLDITIKEYFSFKNLKAKKQVKSFAIKTAVILLLCCATFCLGSQQKYVGEENAIMSYSLFKQDEEYLYYNEATSVELRAEYIPGIHSVKIHTLGKDVVVISIKSDEKELEIDEAAFNGDYSKINKFLNNFDKDIIKYDKESKELLNSYN